MMNNKEKRILVAEDEEADIGLMEIVFRRIGVAEKVDFARNGEEALDHLYGRGTCGASHKPSLIVLDLKLPKVTGLEILKELRADERLKSIPVVIFTSSSDEKDRTECLAGGANDFIIKPIEYKAFSAALTEVVRSYLR